MRTVRSTRSLPVTHQRVDLLVTRTMRRFRIMVLSASTLAFLACCLSSLR